MKTIAYLFLFALLFAGLSEKIIIDVKKVDNLNASVIAENITLVSLKTDEFISPNQNKVFLIDDNIYVFEMYKENDSNYSRVLKFDLQGNYKGRIGEKDPVSKEYLFVFDMKYDETDDLIYLVHPDGNRSYDNNGNFKDFNKANGKLPGLRKEQEIIFRKQIYATEYRFERDTAYTTLVYSDLYGGNKHTIKTFGEKSDFQIFHLPAFSIFKNELYFSNGIDNTLYQVNNGKLSTQFIAEFKNLAPSNKRISVAQTKLGRYVRNLYWINGVNYDLLFNTETKRSFNFRYQRQDGILFSGIKDDLYGTGYFDIKPTNGGDYIYFIKSLSDLKGNKLTKSIKSKTILFLVKLK